MEYADAEQAAIELAEELVTNRRIAKEAERTAKGIRKILLGYLEVFPELEPHIGAVLDQDDQDDDDGLEPTPRGASAVRRILQASPREHFAVSELVDILNQRGWAPVSENPANAVRAALERLIGDPRSDVRKYSNGNRVTYCYDPDYVRVPTGPPAGYDQDEEPF